MQPIITITNSRSRRLNDRKTALKKFLYYFPRGFQDATYRDWERNYKWTAHELWEEKLGKGLFSQLLAAREYQQVCRIAVQIESKTNLLFSFEKMAIRDAVTTGAGAELFAKGLYSYIHDEHPLEKRFEAFTNVLEQLPRKQTRVVTWPIQTVFGFLANPAEFIFLKPMVTKKAAIKYGVDFMYASKPNWDTYKSLLDFANQVKEDTKTFKPADMIDLQSFIWVLGSEEYPD